MSNAEGDARHDQSAQGTPSWVSAALLIAGITVVARIIGFLRFVFLAQTLGTTCLSTAYVTANAVPNIVYELVVGGALVAVVVPLIARSRETDHQRVREMTAALHGWALLLLVPITGAMYLASGWVIDLLLGSTANCPSDTSMVATEMLWVFLLQIPVYGATVIAQGALQAHHRFFAPAVAPAISSLVVIGSYLVYAEMAGPDRSLGTLTDAEFWVLAGGTTLGVVVLLLVQIPALVRARLIVLPTLRFPAGQAMQAGTLAWSGAIVVGSQWVAYAAAIRWSNVYGGEGSALIFALAWTIFLLPWSVLALPIATSTFPRISTLHARNDRDGAARATAVSLRAVVGVSAIGAAGLAAASVPLASIMLKGAPGEPAVIPLATFLVALAPGVLAYGVQGHLVRVLAASHQAPLAAAGTVAGWVVGLVVAWVLVREASDAAEVARAIGLGFSVGLVVAAVILVLTIVRVEGSQAVAGVAKLTLGAGLAALVVGWLGHTLLDDSTSIAMALVQTALVGLVSALVVGGVVLLVDPSSARTLLRMRSRREAVVDSGE